MESLVRADSEVPSQAGSEQNEQVALVQSYKADQSRTAGRAAIMQIAEFYRRMWLIIGVTVMVAFGYYSAWSYLVPNYLCREEIKNARVQSPPPPSPARACAHALLQCCPKPPGSWALQHAFRSVYDRLVTKCRFTTRCSSASLSVSSQMAESRMAAGDEEDVYRLHLRQ